MQLESVHFKHIGMFRELDLEFDPEQYPITLILGDQATGKSTILKNIYQSLTWFSARYKDIRTAGVVIADQDIMLNRLQAKIEIQVHMSQELAGNLVESSSAQQSDTHSCAWKLYKTFNSQSVGISQVETQQLDQMVNLYQRTGQQDPLFGLPLIAYYPAERFVQDINLQSKNTSGILQEISAYDLTAVPYTTFTRFFEWLREISDVENAHSAHIVRRLMGNDFNQHNQSEILQELQRELINHPKQLSAPNLYALKNSLHTVFPELDDIYIQYVPKLQLMVRYQEQLVPFQYLSASLKTWIALVGDISRRLCLLNQHCFNPCLEGEGILMIDQVDHQLDQSHCAEILERLHQAFPCLQIIVTGNRDALLEHALHYQCLKLDQKGIYQLNLQASQQQLSNLYQTLSQAESTDSVPTHTLLQADPPTNKVDDLFQQIQDLNEQEKTNLLHLLKIDDTPQESPL
ncbi:AAA family ATPase [Acinetobacter colistiniresistens]|uniref:AAA family ATPase n=1 Tax=Acinetobacter colistiniresistens TaxID=280145 RepID=UPI00211BE8FF|nr:AAA family ATPase [Acinetobacter colistiniresistens]UUM27876.1 AAA family ATPase [Acinetobacter colistiniresistens]